jgi:hypothetical protein
VYSTRVLKRLWCLPLKKGRSHSRLAMKPKS